MARRRLVPFFITERKAKNPSRRAPRYKVALVKDAGSIYVTAKPIKQPAMIVPQLHELFEDIDREAFYIVMLDQGSRVIGVNLVSVGTLSSSLVHPREVFKAAILLNSASIIAVHNHPSGSPEPSGHDRTLTDRLDKAGELLGIPLKDHIVVGDPEGFPTYFSFKEQGIL